MTCRAARARAVALILLIERGKESCSMDLCCDKPNLNSCMIKRRKARGEEGGEKNLQVTSAKIFRKHDKGTAYLP